MGTKSDDTSDLTIRMRLNNPGTGMFFAADLARILNGVAQAQALTVQAFPQSELGIAVRRIQQATLAAVAIACGLEVAE